MAAYSPVSTIVYENGYALTGGHVTIDSITLRLSDDSNLNADNTVLRLSDDSNLSQTLSAINVPMSATVNVFPLG